MQKSGKTSKIDFYKFISPKGIKAGDDSEGTAAANVIAVKTVKANNQIGKTLNGIGAVLQDIHKKMAVNAMMEADYHKELKKSIADDSKPKNTKPVAEKRSGITDFLAPVVGSFFEGLANLAGWFLKTFVARAVLQWLSNPENFEKLTNIVEGIKAVGMFIYNFFKGTIGGILDGIAKMWDPEASWWEKLLGFGQFFISLGTLLLGLRWLKNPLKLVKDFVWVLTTLYNNLLRGKKRMKARGRFGLVKGLVATTVVVGGAGLIINATNNASDDDMKSVANDGKNTVPVGDSGSKKYAIMTYGTDQHKDPDKAAEYVSDQLTKAKEMGYNTVFIPPSSQGDKFAEVSEATTNAAQAAGAIIENASFDPDKEYEKMMPSSMKAIQSKYNGAAVFGDKFARLADKPNRVGGANTLPKLEGKAAGGWIHGPQSGYPVSLDGGRSVSFIGHGTEYVAQRSGGGFVVPFDTPATRKNPGLTGQRIGEASRGGFKLGGMLPGFDMGGALAKMLPRFSAGGKITAIQQKALDVLAKYESGAAGYNAVNQIGTNAGRGVEGFSGNFTKMKQHGGKALTSLTIGDIKKLQYDDKSMSDSQWINAGKLHAVGRYQFIGNTLPGVAKRAGLKDSDLFSEKNQDMMAIQLMKERGISPWVGPSDKATKEERAIVAAVQQNRSGAGLLDYDLGTTTAAEGTNASEGAADTTAELTPEQKLNFALEKLVGGIKDVRGVMHGSEVAAATEDNLDAKDQAEKNEVSKTEEQMAAATAIATSVSKATAGKAVETAAGAGGGQKTIVVPTEEKEGLLSFMPGFGLFGGSS